MAAGGPDPGRRRVLLVAHLAEAGLILTGAAVLAIGPEGDGVSLAALGVGELILLGIAAGIVVLFDRYGPLLLVDVLVAAPLAAVLFGAEAGGLSGILAAALVVAALAAAVLAALEVRHGRLERIGIAAALVALALALGGAPLAAAIPIAILVVLVAPDVPASWRTGPRRPAAMAASRSGSSAGPTRRRLGSAPDAAAVLAGRDARGGRAAVLHSAPHGEDREE
jgi:hypothetical protein